MKYGIILLLVALGGCQTTQGTQINKPSLKLARCDGQAFGLNPRHWQPTKADIKACSAPVSGQ